MKSKGFSLVEMLIVIAILMALIGMLLPALNRAKEAGRQINCQSNLKQIGHAGISYASEHDDRWIAGANQDNPPLGMGRSAYSVWGDNWLPQRSIDRYRGIAALYKLQFLTDSRVFYCPSWNHVDAAWGNCQSGASQNGWPADDDPVACGTTRLWTSYAYRSTFNLTAASPKGRASVVSDPGRQAVMADHFSDPSRGVQYHHDTGYSTLFLDGHVTFRVDRNRFVEQYNTGAAYDATPAGYILQEEVWDQFFDREQ